MRILSLLGVTMLALLGCGHSGTQYVEQGQNGPYDTRVSPNGYSRPTLPDSTTVDHVEYNNPKTGTHSDYDLEVDRDSDGNVQRINFPNGGWKEVDGQGVDNGDGTETFTDDRGYQYTVSKSDSGDSQDKSGD